MLKEKIAAEFKKMSVMRFSEKREYILEYYKWLIVGIALFFILIASLINHYVFNPPKDSYAGIVLYGNITAAELIDATTAKLNEALVENKKEEEIILSNIYDVPNDLQYNMAMQQKFIATLAAGEVDVIIAEKEIFTGLAANGYLTKLSEFYPSGEFNNFGEIVNAPLVDFDPVSGKVLSMSEEFPFGVSLKDSEFLKSVGIDSSNLVIGIVPEIKGKKTEIMNDRRKQIMDCLLKPGTAKN